MKLNLNINEQVRLRAALEGLDGFEQVVPGIKGDPKVVRVPYKLGAERRAVVKNINAINRAVGDFEQSRLALVKEIWPDKPTEKSITREDDPDGFARFEPEMQKLISTKEELSLERLSADVLYAAGDVPTDILTVLEEFNLVAEAESGSA